MRPDQSRCESGRFPSITKLAFLVIGVGNGLLLARLFLDQGDISQMAASKRMNDAGFLVMFGDCVLGYINVWLGRRSTKTAISEERHGQGT